MNHGQRDPSFGWGMTRSVSVALLAAACAVSCSSSPAPADRVVMTSSAIQGGTTDATHTFAVGVVQLAQEAQNMVAFCSGVLLAPNLVATARHCVAELTSTTIDCTSSTFGALYPASQVLVTIDTTITMNSAFKSVSKVIVPTGANQTAVCGNDIALMILDENITLPQYAEPVITPPMTDAQYRPVVTAIGYGIDTPTDTQGNSAGIRRIREDVPLTCIPNDSSFTDCFTDPSAKSVLTAAEFVSGDSTCEGDSGSAAFEQGNFDNGKWLAFGVLSRGGVSQDGTTCDQPIYSRFDAWGSLIVGAAQQAAQQASANGAGYPLAVWAGGTGLADGGSTVATLSNDNDAAGPTVGADEGSEADSGGGSSSGGCSLGAGRRPAAPMGAPASGLALLGLAAVGGLRRQRRARSSARSA
jgi:secreted trypsin-like serine protease